MALALRHWKRAEYDRLIDLGVFVDEPLELIGGQRVVAEPKGPYHVTGVALTADALRATLPAGWHVRTEAPIALDDDSEPEPDIAAVPGSYDDYLHAHPARPALVVEVSDLQLDFDRTHKASLYARGGIADYWIVNLIDRVLEIYREPVRDTSAPYGWRYGSVRTLPPTATATPLAIPSASVAVADLLPTGSRTASRRSRT
ncbi:MAG: Uma2 family endonuclease [Candidatus Rokubacteria bacterium]|nr:Uma2 family endonuclease [Candidatus Rokubacteria bacterium]